eukprot:CAMPEP_0172160058 /NCGR_PEP_ID=MMETSP1050-20130122/5343_1 /TAXON_ID=233186 /ORGANISM="Cryptomonas curvata, Strain CCAP979/52" /LENGTH=167 /DNA_ID=CAMNT_0012829771 /DNA_START=746 /DNA_END=1245 /DNA_ORIENTATION=-
MHAKPDEKLWFESALERFGPSDDKLILSIISAKDFSDPQKLRAMVNKELIKKGRCALNGRFMPCRPFSNIFSLRGSFSEREDDEETVRELMRQVDPNSLEELSTSALDIFLKKLVLAEADSPMPLHRTVRDGQAVLYASHALGPCACAKNSDLADMQPPTDRCDGPH